MGIRVFSVLDYEASANGVIDTGVEDVAVAVESRESHSVRVAGKRSFFVEDDVFRIERHVG